MAFLGSPIGRIVDELHAELEVGFSPLAVRPGRRNAGDERSSAWNEIGQASLRRMAFQEGDRAS